jgi:hypothetical protein
MSSADRVMAVYFYDMLKNIRLQVTYVRLSWDHANISWNKKKIVYAG